MLGRGVGGGWLEEEEKCVAISKCFWCGSSRYKHHKNIEKYYEIVGVLGVAAPGARGLARRGTRDQPLAKRDGPGKIWSL